MRTEDARVPGLMDRTGIPARTDLEHLGPLHGPVLDQRPRRLPPPRTDRAARRSRALYS
ncbi:hypothetical protein F750_0530 [Streptomyces sp. PAMC 26508]|nr:hypothetical protein F750_0530 [Streptomyces sp. PAMC 26508]